MPADKKMKKNILSPDGVVLALHGSSLLGNVLESVPVKVCRVPLSVLQGVFGAMPGAPWFYEGIEVDEAIERELSQYICGKLDHSSYRYRFEVQGDGIGCFAMESLLSAITVRRSDLKGVDVVHVFSEPERILLHRIYRRHRLGRNSYPYIPYVMRVDSWFVSEVLAPAGIEIDLIDSGGGMFMDLLFNGNEERGPGEL